MISLFTKYNINRLAKYQLETSIYEEEGIRKVRKKPMTDEALFHLNNIYINSQKTMNLYNNLQVLVPEFVNNELHYPFIKGKRWCDILLELLDHTDKLAFIQKLKLFADIILKVQSGSKKKFVSCESFRETFSFDLVLEEAFSVNPANIDMTFDNIIDTDDVPVIIDCEWVYNFEIPTTFILYRSVYSFWTKHQLQIRPHFELQELYNIVGIEIKELGIYDIMEKNFQELVHVSENLGAYKKKSYSTQNIVRLINDNEFFTNIYLPVNGEYKYVQEVRVNQNQEQIKIKLTDPCEDHIRIDFINKAALIEIKSLKIIDLYDESKTYELSDGSNAFSGLTFSDDVKVLSKDETFSLMLLSSETHLFFKINQTYNHGFKLLLEMNMVHIIDYKILNKVEHLEQYLENQKQSFEVEKQQYEQVIKEKSEMINEFQTEIDKYQIAINNMEFELRKTNKFLNEILTSRSWKITAPIRKALKIFKVKE